MGSNCFAEYLRYCQTLDLVWFTQFWVSQLTEEKNQRCKGTPE